MGAKLELRAMGPLMVPEAHLEWMRHWRRVRGEETAVAVKEVGAQNFILATDLSQSGNPSPADGLQLFVTDLMKAGLSKDQITTMGREVTSKLVMVETLLPSSALPVLDRELLCRKRLRFWALLSFS